MGVLRVSHYTLTSCLGAGLDAHRAALHAGRSGLAPCTFDSVEVKLWSGEVPGLADEPIEGTLADFDCRNNRLAQLALREDGFLDAVAEVRGRYGAGRVAVILGSSTSGILSTELAYRQRDPETGRLPQSFHYAGTHNAFSIARFVAAFLDLKGPTQSLSAACATTAKVFMAAQRMFRAGLCDAAIVGGADTLCLTTLYGFHALELTSEAPCRPFDAGRSGISLGEAGGFAILERASEATGMAFLGGGESCDAYHMSSPHPEGLGAKIAMERALENAGLTPREIDYVNAHGTATRVGDSSEDHALGALFAPETPCSSTKGLTGHTLGAAGITEAVLSLLCLEDEFVPGCANTEQIDPSFERAYVTNGYARPLARVMSNSFGFGGSNCSLIFGRGA